MIYRDTWLDAETVVISEPFQLSALRDKPNLYVPFSFRLWAMKGNASNREQHRACWSIRQAEILVKLG
jgi:hypothetical protein